MAAFTIYNNKKVARLRATLDVVLKNESDKYYIELYENFIKVRDKQNSLLSKSHSELIAIQDPIEFSEDQDDIDNFLNHYELIAIGINNKILDEDFYKSWMKSTYIKHYENAENYIKYLQSSDYKNAFINFQKLAIKWRKKS